MATFYPSDRHPTSDRTRRKPLRQLRREKHDSSTFCGRLRSRTRTEAVMTMHVGRTSLRSSCVSLFSSRRSARRPVHAQAIHEGKLTGTVASEDGAALPGATVEISSPALLGGTRSATTSAHGTYVFLNLPIGRYTVTASLAGFKTVVRENIEVSADATVTLDLVAAGGGGAGDRQGHRRGPDRRYARRRPSIRGSTRSCSPSFRRAGMPSTTSR